jgi:exopolysaccharide biosynthesis polyprenyl glycosylphosphotransferase
VISTNAQRAKYVAVDFITSSVAWFLYNIARYNFGGILIEGQGFTSAFSFLLSANVLIGQVIFPLLMLGIFYLSGYYSEVFRKSRLQEFVTTFASTLVNTLIIFFVVLINDVISVRSYNYELILMLWGVTFAFVYLGRCIITGLALRRIHNRRWKFPTLIIGAGKNAVDFVTRLQSLKRSLGYDVIGYVTIPGDDDSHPADLPTYSLGAIRQVCADRDVKEIIMLPTRIDPTVVMTTVNQLLSLNRPIKVSPDLYGILMSKVRMNNIYGEPLIDISVSNMSASSLCIKRVLDVAISIVTLIILSPVFAVIAIAIKRGSKGKVIFRQERIGYHNKPFMIYKFRTMCEGAESDGTPQLSKDGDERVTKLGRFMRKYRIDELPQFWNVINGTMSIVGPRPERQFYINQIVKVAPDYTLLHQVRPGITSLGMVKYGYARNVEEMVGRLKYDLMYMENMSILNDMKIVIYTVKTVITGQGL